LIKRFERTGIHRVGLPSPGFNKTLVYSRKTSEKLLAMQRQRMMQPLL